MKFAALLALLSLTTTVAAKHYCFGGCVKCYCGDIKYDDHKCSHCSCDENAYKSQNPNNPQGTCDQPGGFHLGCGSKLYGKCL